MSGATTDQVLDALLRQLLEILGQHRLRTSELLQRANITDRRTGEAAVWTLLKRGFIAIGPDSKLGDSRTNSCSTPPRDNLSRHRWGRVGR